MTDWLIVRTGSRFPSSLDGSQPALGTTTSANAGSRTYTGMVNADNERVLFFASSDGSEHAEPATAVHTRAVARRFMFSVKQARPLRRLMTQRHRQLAVPGTRAGPKDAAKLLAPVQWVASCSDRVEAEVRARDDHNDQNRGPERRARGPRRTGRPAPPRGAGETARRRVIRRLVHADHARPTSSTHLALKAPLGALAERVAVSNSATIIAGSCAARPCPSARYAPYNADRSSCATSSITSHARCPSGSRSRQAWWQQQLLIAVAREEVLRHPRRVLSGYGTDARTPTVLRYRDRV